jgi:hypothetical protein
MNQSVQAEAVLECDCLAIVVVIVIVIVIVIVGRGGSGRGGSGRGGHLTAAIECKQVIGTHFCFIFIYHDKKKTG